MKPEEIMTTDLSDANEYSVAIAAPIFRDFGGNLRFFGQIVTVQTMEDNTLVRQAAESPGKGRVLVVDGSGSLAVAMLGDQVAQIASDNGWSGFVINGAIRDSEAVGKTSIGVKAIATVPNRSRKENTGRTDVPVHFAGITFHPGHWLYADPDGILVSPVELSAPG